MTTSKVELGFSPVDPTDRRKRGDWKSRYVDPEARRGIRIEAVYLASILVLVPSGMLLLWLEYPRAWLNIPQVKYEALTIYGIAWLGGTLGGTLFGIKWLYHVVAREIWHLDRRLWRLFTPHLSGGFAFAVVALVASGIVSLFHPDAMQSLSLVAGLSFLVGYFSDNAVAKLSEVAMTLFGASNRKGGRMRERLENDEA